MTPRKRPEYEVQVDTVGTYSAGQVIPDVVYDSVKEGYDIRLKVWDGGTVQISGQKRDMIKSFLEEKRYVITSEHYHYLIRTRGKKTDPSPICQKVRELGLKLLSVRVIGELVPDEDRGR
jgi:hypothetical protein